MCAALCCCWDTGERGSASHEPFTSQCGSARFVRSAWPMAMRWRALGARTGVRDRECAKHTPFTSQCGNARFVLSAWPMAIQCSSLGARTGARTAKLRAHDPRAKRMLFQKREVFGEGRPSGRTNAFPLAWSLRGWVACG